MKKVVIAIAAVIIIVLAIEIFTNNSVSNMISELTDNNRITLQQIENNDDVSKIIGWDVSKMEQQPLDFIKAAQKKVDKKILELQEHSIVIRKLERESEKNSQAAKQQLEKEIEFFTMATNLLSDSQTQYPVEIGGYNYTEDMLLEQASSAKDSITSLKKDLGISGDSAIVLQNESIKAGVTYAKLQEQIELLLVVKTELNRREQVLQQAEKVSTIDDSIKEGKELADVSNSVDDLIKGKNKVNPMRTDDISNKDRLKSKVLGK